MPVPSRLSAPVPGWTRYADVVVVGSGIAGLSAALRIREGFAARGHVDAFGAAGLPFDLYQRGATR